MEDYLRAQLGSQASQILEVLPRLRMQARVINQSDVCHDFSSQSCSLDGAIWHECERFIHPNVVEYDPAYDMTIINLPLHQGQEYGHQNFAIIMDSNIEQNLIDAFTKNEMETSISNFEQGYRPGPASGVAMLGDSCRGFTNVTKNDTTLYLPSSPKAVNLIAHYFNYDGIMKKTSFGYKFLYMKRMSKQQKSIEAAQQPYYRAILMAEAICYIIGLAARSKTGNPHAKDEIDLTTLRTILSCNKEKSLEDCLVLWMCVTGKMRNHQALCCHVDINRSHRFELYTLFSRHGIGKKDGYIYLPLHNVVLKICCDKQLMLCNFSKAPHVPDSSRNMHNFSKVRGPHP